MILRNILNDYSYRAGLSTESSASSHGQAVLVDLDAGEPIDQFSMGATEVVEASEAELEELAAAGYFPGPA